MALMLEPDQPIYDPRCDAFAESWITKQTGQFKRLGVLGDWDHPYLTLDATYEGAIARALQHGLLPRSARPDATAVEALLQRMQLNVQVTGMLDDSSRYADIILPLSDTLASYVPRATPGQHRANRANGSDTPASTSERARPSARRG